MSGPIRSKIGPCAARTKAYIEAATVNLGKDTTDVSIQADLTAERRGLRRAIRLLEDCNDKWQSLLLKFNGADRQQEEQRYDDLSHRESTSWNGRTKPEVQWTRSME